jgi:hypothetical protein
MPRKRADQEAVRTFESELEGLLRDGDDLITQIRGQSVALDDDDKPPDIVLFTSV